MNDQMPVMMQYHERQKFPDCPRFFPFSLLNEDWAQFIHSQTLERLAQRGGMSPTEILKNVRRERFEESSRFTEQYAVAEIRKLLNTKPPTK